MTMTGLETIKAVRERQPETLLAFSTGKDAVAAWLAIRDHFDRVHPYYLYLVPGLEFVEHSLDYYERFFGEKIARLPHPSLHRWLNNFTFQPPERCAVIEQANLPEFDYTDICRALIDDKGLQAGTLAADGVRAADSPLRRIAIKTHGPISKKQGKYHPVWDWKKQDLIDCFAHYGVKLPEDYKLFGRSFDGLDLRFLLPLKRHRPADYRRVLDWFPLCDLEVFRWEAAHGKA
ncbi:phosphoadenosine phosphosulfate reductase [Acidovorax sp.]|uniref:phosphoadenosine phosphosulfate reductase n=1 Tax=Acidovorax sp. TaxID=1872122 RepID=UPI0025C08FC4|nr:phosphoadenosine phosphosulfate reductase [Acidovorax sp.]MBW8464858.1 phosphoadenosine phosphosulfate reductase [Acidovorax sp.]